MTAGLRKTAALLALAVMFTGCSAPAESESGAALPDVVGSMDIRYAEQFSVDYLADGSALAEVADGRRYLIIPGWGRGSGAAPGGRHGYIPAGEYLPCFVLLDGPFQQP